MKHNYCISITFNNKPGFIIRVALILERRGHNIHSINVTERASEPYSDMLLIGSGDSSKFDQIIKQLSKLVDVVSVQSAEEQMSGMEEASLVSFNNYAYTNSKPKAAAAIS